MTSYEQIQQALSFIPAHDRDTWVRMAMAIKAELGEGGFSLWNEWSRTADNYKSGDAKDVWRSIKQDGGITVGSCNGSQSKQPGTAIKPISGPD
jgi:putative DNA primase/helicase